MYWCVSSTSANDGELIKAKWLSLDNHIHNIHRRHGKKFSKCAHGRLGRRKWLQRRKWFICISCAWFIFTSNILIHIDTKASEKLTSLINNNNHLKDMCRLSSVHQTSALESFHNIVIHFAPKSVAFSYQGMKSR